MGWQRKVIDVSTFGDATPRKAAIRMEFQPTPQTWDQAVNRDIDKILALTGEPKYTPARMRAFVHLMLTAVYPSNALPASMAQIIEDRTCALVNAMNGWRLVLYSVATIVGSADAVSAWERFATAQIPTEDLPSAAAQLEVIKELDAVRAGRRPPIHPAAI